MPQTQSTSFMHISIVYQYYIQDLDLRSAWVSKFIDIRPSSAYRIRF